MRKNFHEIKAIISENKFYKEHFYGMAEYIHGMISNRIKFKNLAVQSKLYFQTRIEENSAKFRNNNLYTILLSALRPKENVIKFTNDIKVKLIALIKSKDENKINFLNNSIAKFNILFRPKINKNKFKIKNNEPKIDVALQGRIDENKFFIDNVDDGTHSVVTLDSKIDKNNITIQNSTVNAGTWKFLTLGDISGTLNEIEKSPLEYLGRRKIVQ